MNNKLVSKLSDLPYALRTNRYGIYYVKFRVSKSLIKYFQKEFITKSLSTKILKQAHYKASVIRGKYLEITRVAHLLNSEHIQVIVDEYIRVTIQQPTDSVKPSTKTTEIAPKQNEQSQNIKDMLELYLKWYQKTDIQSGQYKIVKNRLELAVNYFGASKSIAELSTEDIEEYIDFLTQYPQTQKMPYCRMSYEQIVSLETVPKEDLLSTTTVIKYIKAFRQMENYLFDDGKLNRKISKRANLPTVTSVETTRFTSSDVINLFNIFDTLDDKKYIYYTYALTGMRTSEFWKCKIATEEGIYFFDLSYDGVELKTKSSKRKIPIHSKLLNMGIVDRLNHIQNTFTQNQASQYFNGILVNELEEPKGKVLYGFRHTVATYLKRAGVDIDKISEILGHSYKNSTITKTVYASGYSLQQLREVIEMLDY